MATAAASMQLTVLGAPVSMFDRLPQELILMTTEFLGPYDLYNFMISNKHLCKFILPRLPYFVRLYAKSSRLEVERFMWRSFYNKHYIIKNKYQLFFSMVSIYKFSTTTLLEGVWRHHKMDDNESYGPLPVDPTELYIKKFQAGMFSMLGKLPSLVSSMYSHTSDCIEIFEFMFKFIIKYPKTALAYSDSLEEDICNLTIMFRSFEVFDEIFTQILSYGVSEIDAYVLFDEEPFLNEFLKYVSFGINGINALEDAEYFIYDDDMLEVYNAVRYIIGNEFAYHYILCEEINMDDYPNFLKNIVRLRSIGVTDVSIVDNFLEDPTDEHFNLIQLSLSS